MPPHPFTMLEFLTQSINKASSVKPLLATALLIDFITCHDLLVRVEFLTLFCRLFH